MSSERFRSPADAANGATRRPPCLGKEEIRRRGFKDRDAFAESIAGPLYSHLPPAPEGELQTGTAACVEAPPSRPCSQLPSAPTEKLHATA